MTRDSYLKRCPNLSYQNRLSGGEYAREFNRITPRIYEKNSNPLHACVLGPEEVV
jgi:hypothetical protein